MDTLEGTIKTFPIFTKQSSMDSSMIKTQSPTFMTKN